MKILHFSTTDTSGGSSRSAFRIHNGLLGREYDSHMYVGKKFSEEINVTQIPKNSIQIKLDSITNRITQKIGLQYYFIPSNYGFAKRLKLTSKPILQFYNLHGGYLSWNTLNILSTIGPIVWRFSDLWPITGHCAYPGNCEGYKNQCGNCPDLNTYPAIGIDTTSLLWKKKYQLVQNANLVAVATSSWAEEAIKTSTIFHGKEVFRIPNGIDTEVFKPIPREFARQKLGIKDNRKAILFCAHVTYDNPRKGTDFLEKILRELETDENWIFIVAGEKSEQWIDKIPNRVFALPFTKDSSELCLYYNASDIVCIPSSEENLPNTALESISCGKPIVALDSGGLKDIVIENQTGFLCEKGDDSKFLESLRILLTEKFYYKYISESARKIALKEFSLSKEIDRFEEIYQKLNFGFE